jgi:hypothetical protein
VRDLAFSNADSQKISNLRKEYNLMQKLIDHENFPAPYAFVQNANIDFGGNNEDLQGRDIMIMELCSGGDL